MENFLYIQKTTSGFINQSSNLIFDNIMINNGSISYNCETGVISLNEIGCYHFNWWISMQSTSNTTNVQFSLVSDDDLIISNSPIKMNNFSGLGVVNVLTPPVNVTLKNTSGGKAYLSTNAQIKAMMSIQMLSESGASSTFYNFQYMQLVNVLSQIITKYPENVISVFVRGLYYVIGTPTSIYSSSSGPGLFIVTDAGDVQAIPLNMITGVYIGDDTAYDETITYLTPSLPYAPGWDTNVITSVYDYLPVGTAVEVVFSIGNSREGFIYKDEYGMIVVTADMEGANPTFIPATEASIIIFPAPAKKTHLRKIEIK